ncbi:MAG TPA: hypothetical protein PKL99_04820 [Syntrophales bacterium]|nr:hypothetical protein [Syntrophales bacterium]
MKKKVFVVAALLFLVSWVFAGPAAADQVVRIPYMVSVGGWSTGVAITNLADTDITGLTLDMVKASGAWHSVISNYRTNLGTLNDYAMMVDYIGNLYGKTWTEERFWCEIWHSGTEKFAVSVFIMNVTTGQAEGFGFHPFFSESRSHTFDVYVGPLVK